MVLGRKIVLVGFCAVILIAFSSVADAKQSNRGRRSWKRPRFSKRLGFFQRGLDSAEDDAENRSLFNEIAEYLSTVYGNDNLQLNAENDDVAPQSRDYGDYVTGKGFSGLLDKRSDDVAPQSRAYDDYETGKGFSEMLNTKKRSDNVAVSLFDYYDYETGKSKMLNTKKRSEDLHRNHVTMTTITRAKDQPVRMIATSY
ncbi:unnamed protein product [Owenia fusiformis]|uniref:Uncharacterized protein n=1 Tax=Owenia fusiformis TaxID=6347 RepID=A0A8S4PWF1_OWEFU|nr:unnamed protein product [Owenia fusiformis]